MSKLPLVFQVLAEPLTAKKILEFRKDAGWKDKVMPVQYQDPRGFVQWAAVMIGKRQIGIVRMELAPPEFCYVSDLIIRKEFRSQGVGHWFLQCIEQFCRERGVPRLVLQAAEGSTSFYEELGFQPDPGVATLLRKDIPFLKPRSFVG